MTTAVKNLLKNYASESPAVLARLAGLLNHGLLAGTGKLLIYPVDQGFEHGPAVSFAKNPSAYDPIWHFQLAVEGGCSAYAAPFGFLSAGAREFAGQIPLILKANSSDSLFKDPVKPLPAVTSGVEEALRLGCSAIGFTIYPGSGDRVAMYEDVVRLGREARRAGLALVVWAYPRGGKLSKKGETALDVVAYSAHIACQLGAHIVKVKPPANFFETKSDELYKKTGEDFADLSWRTAHVVQAGFAGRRIVVFSGGPAKGEQEILKEIELLSRGGSFGSIVGRNVFQRPKEEALVLLQKIAGIYKKQVS